MKKLTHLSLAILAICGTSNQASAVSDIPDVIIFEPSVITATRTPQQTSDIIAQTTVIDSFELERYQGQTVLEILRDQLGIHIKQNGGLGSNSNFYMRGYDSKSILVLVDGVQYKSITSGQSALHLLATDHIERIEILHGASGSSIYGSDAVGGVIQVFTKGSLNKDSSEKSADILVGYGSHNHKQASVSTQYNTDRTSINIGASKTNTEGFDATKQINIPHFPDKDGYEVNAINLGLSQIINDNIRTGLSVLYNESDTEYDSYSDWKTGVVHKNAHTEQKNGAANVFFEFSNDSINTRLSHGQSIDNSKDFSNGNDLKYHTTFDTLQKHTRLENHIKIQNNLGLITLGLENLQQEVNSDTNYIEKSREINSGFLGYQFTHDNFDIQANYRLDDNSQYGKHDTYNLGFALSPTENARFGANYSTGFSSPTFNDLYYPEYDNPALNPETSKNSELFIELHNKLHRTRLTAYQNDIDNKIASGTDYKRYNTDSVEVSGLNVTSDWKLDNLLLGLGYDYQDSEILVNANNKGKELRQSPNHKAAAYIGYLGDDYDFRIEHEYVGTSFIKDDNIDSLESYRLINLSGSYYFTENVTGKLQLNNVTNKQYETVKGYNTADRSYFASLSYSF